MEQNPLDIAKAISDYGPYAVILGIVLALFIYSIYNNHKMYKKFQEKQMTKKNQQKKMNLN